MLVQQIQVVNGPEWCYNSDEGVCSERSDCKKFSCENCKTVHKFM